jgi:hypothetical protein
MRKSWLSGLHGARGREGAAHMAWATRLGGGGTSAGSNWRREKERDPRSVGRHGRLVARGVGSKATGPKGRTGWRGSWANWAGTEEKFFSK